MAFQAKKPQKINLMKQIALSKKRNPGNKPGNKKNRKKLTVFYTKNKKTAFLKDLTECVSLQQPPPGHTTKDLKKL